MGWETKSPLQHPWNVSVDEAIKIQLNLVPFVSLKDEFVQIRKIASVGFTFLPENKLKAACALFSFPQLKLLSSKITLQNLNFAYISGFLAFSVGPALISVLTQIEKPDLVIFPGRGVAHPRSMGLATHLGILLEVPSVACSKRPLGFEYKNPPSSKGSFTFVYDKGKKLVAVLRSKTRVNPIFVTSGHKVTLDTAVELVLKMCTKYRLPEPLRIASILAKKIRFVFFRMSNKIIVYLLIFFLGVGTFYPILFNFFVSDDFIWIKFSSDIEGNKFLLYKGRQVQNGLFFAVHKIFGLNPAVYHTLSICMHILNSFLVYNLFQLLGVSPKASLVSCLIFLLHFVQEEPVFWISSISVLVALFFSLFSTIWLIKWIKHKKLNYYSISIVLALLAVLSREEGAVLPFGLLLVSIFLYPESVNSKLKKIKTSLKVTLPHFSVIILYLIFRFQTVPHDILGQTFRFDFVNSLKNLVYFCVHLVIPVRAISDLVGYEKNTELNQMFINMKPSFFFTVVAGILIIAICYLFILFFRKIKTSELKLGTIIFILGFLPYIFLNGVGPRFIYFSSVGFSLVLTVSVFKLANYLSRGNVRLNKVVIVFVTVLLINVLVMRERASWWRKSGQISEKIVEESGKVISSLPEESLVYFLDLPLRLNGAYIFFNGFTQAIELYYPEKKLNIVMLRENEEPLSLTEENVYLFRYQDGIMKQLRPQKLTKNKSQ